MMKTTRVVMAVVGILVVVGLILFMRDRSARAQAKGGTSGAGSASPAGSGAGERAVPVATAAVLRKDVPVIVEGLGTVTPLATVTQKTQVDGRLDQVLFTEGQTVKKGDVIALVDPRPFQIQLHTAEAALFRDDAQLRNGKLNLERYETLRKTNLIPQQQVDDQRTMVDQLDAASRTDRAQIEAARLNLDYARITSPIDGVTGLRQVDPGNLVHQVDTNGIVVITQIDPIAVLFTVPQDELPRVQQALGAGKVSVDVFGRDGLAKIATGELLLVDNQVNSQTATIRLKAVFPNPTHVLWPNAFVKARMQVTVIKDALVVPASVVQRGPSGTFCYVMAPDKTVQPKNVEVGTIEGDVATIASGLAENDIVIVDGQNQLKAGSKVAPRAPTAKSPQAAAADSAAPAGTGAGPTGSAARPRKPSTDGAHP